MFHLKQPRRTFLQIGATGVFTAILSSLPKISFTQSAPDIDKGIVVYEDDSAVQNL